MGGAVTGTKFYFFTDPTLLEPQAPAQAYGPAGTSGGKDRFRVTDLHQRKSSSTADVPAFAICDGLLCAQVDAGGTLSLILKPIEQPPFDFPFISYIIYKGIDPASLLISGNADSGGTIDTTKAADNKLVDSVQKSWAANNNSGDPTRECLGLHLTPASTAANYPDLDLSKYADAKPLDNLFYQGDTKFQLPLVRGGWRIGDFASAGFGLKIIVERIGYRPKIALARRLENVIEVASLDPAVTYAPNDATYFMHWHDKEECLNFIDPCALWGSFFVAKLKVWNGGGNTFDRKSGSDIYDVVLRGGYDDMTPASGNFFNRNIVYVDIRNEHDKSFNYYKTNGDIILATFDPSAALEASQQSYQSGAWPIFKADQSMFPSSLAGSVARLRLAFIPGNYNRISFYGAPLDTGRPKKKQSKGQTDYFLPDMPTRPEFNFDLPVYGNGPPRSISGYLSMSVFIFEKKPADEVDATLELFPCEAPDGIPYEAFDIPFEKPDSAALKTFSQPYLLRIPFVSREPVAYQIGWIRAGAEAVLLLAPATFDARDLGAPLAMHSGDLAAATLLEAVGRVIRPFVAVVRQTGAGKYYVDYSPPVSLTARIPRSLSRRFMLVLTHQLQDDLLAASGSDVATLTVAPFYTGDDSNPLVIAVSGLRTESGKVGAFSAALDMGALSNVDAY